MQKAKDIMTTSVVTLDPGTTVVEAARMLIENKINGAPVVDKKGELVGVLCQSDLVAQQKRLTMPTLFTLLDGFITLSSQEDLDREIERISAVTVAQAMTAPPRRLSPDTPVDEIATIMVDKKLYTLPVLDAAGRLVGVVGKEDVLKTLFG
ncbi:MAG: CBS domain-containing protein [Desulfovibrionaceae bacterium]|nr:CBS domain-containing protein [Desulfovibrionaceae bacterium]